MSDPESTPTTSASPAETPSPLSDSDGAFPTHRASSEPPPLWFADLRSKVAAFSMSTWLTSLGMKKAPSTSQSVDDISSRLDSPKSILSPSSPVRETAELGEPRSGAAAAVTLGNNNGSLKVTRLASPDTIRELEEEGGRVVELLTPTQGTDEESWELPNFWLNLEPGRSYQDTLQLQHFGPLEGLSASSSKIGQGHNFEVTQLANPTWCDKCGDFIWGFYRQAVTCSNCNFTCHYKCRNLVTLDCRSLSDSAKSAGSSDQGTFYSAKSQPSHFKPCRDDNESVTDDFDDNGTEVTELDCEMGELGLDASPLRTRDRDQWITTLPTGDDLRAILDHNNSHSPSFQMTISSDGHSFSGNLQIHMNFTRPINIVSGGAPPPLVDVMADETLVLPGAKARTITSFFLPRNTVKTVHLTSDTTALELIVLLLRKFRVADCPRKFALYTRPIAAKGATLKSKLERVSEDVCPLRLALAWGADASTRFVLQENDTGDILWDAFEIPELGNFLKILDMEEAQYVHQLRQRFSLYKHYLALEIRAKGGNAATIGAPPPPPLKEPRDYADFPTLSSADLDAAPRTAGSQSDWDYYTGTL